jgi:ADP-ribose pyrophosphatase
VTYELMNSQSIYEGHAFKVRADLVRLPNGKTHTFDIVEHRPAVTMIPVDDQGRICFIRQYRHATGKELFELPAGVLEPGEEPSSGARREIREEVGMSAERLEKIGEFFLAPGYSSEYMHVYLAQDLDPDPLPQDEDEFITIERVSIPEAYRLAGSGRIVDAKSLSALMLALPHFLRSGKINSILLKGD